MSDQGQVINTMPGSTGESFQVTEEHLQKLITYICNLSSVVIDADSEKVKNLLFSPQILNTLKLFISEASSKIICITKNEEESPDPSKEYIFETEPTFKEFQNSTIIFLKRVPIIDCSKPKTIKRDLQMFNYNGGSDVSMFSYMQNCIQSAFSPLFSSFQNTLRINLDKANNKAQNYKDVNTKMNELAILLGKAQNSSDIPDVKLETDPLVKAKIEEFYKANGKYPTADEIKDSFDENTFNRLGEIINKWKNDIISYTQLENDLDKGDSLDEINFWRKSEVVCRSIKAQIDSPEIKITLDLAKNARKIFAINSFEDEINLKEHMNTKINFYNMNLKDINILGMLKTSSLSEIPPFLKGIFESIKRNLRTGWYPVPRTLKFLEKIKQDLNKHIIKLLGNNLLELDFAEFENVYTELDQIFDSSWSKEMDGVRREIQTSEKLFRAKYPIDPYLFTNPLRSRIEELKKLREDYKNFLELSQNLFFTQDEDENNSETGKENQRLTKEIQDAYKEFSKVDVLDLSGKGEKKWIDAKEEYRKKTENIENQISNTLKEQLAQAQSSSEQYKIFKRFQQLSQKQRIHLGIQEYQTSLVNEIIKNLSDLLDTLLEGYQSNTASQMSKIKGIPDVSGKIIWLKQFEKKAEAYKKKAAIILGDNWKNVNDGKKINELIESIEKNATSTSKLVEEFNKEALTLDSNDISSERLMDISKKQNKYEIKVNFDEKLIDLFKEVRLLSGKGASVNGIVISRSMENKGNYPYAIALQESFRAFQNSCHKIKNDPRIDKLVAKQKKDILTLISEKYTYNWQNRPKIQEFTSDICEKVAVFEETVTDLLVKVDQIDNCLSQIENSEFNKEIIGEKIKNIQEVLNDINGCSNMAIWIKEIDSQLQTILIKKLEDCTELWLKEFLAPKPLNDAILLQDCSIHKVKLTDQLIYLEPSINDAREYWYNQYHNSIAFILENEHLVYNADHKKKKDNQNVDIYKDNSFRDIMKIANQTIIRGCYIALEKTFEEVEKYMKTWKSYQVLWDIQPKTIYDKLGEETTKWQALMEELKNGQNSFNILETEKIIGSIVIDFASVQTKVKNKYDVWHKEVMNKFAQITNDGMKQFSNTINEARSNLEGSTLESESTDIVSYITEVQNFTKNKEMWQKEMEKYKNSKKILDSQRYRFKGDFANMDQLESEWSKFEQILNKKSKEMDEKIPSIIRSVIKDKNRLNDEIKKLDEFWSKNKPETADNPVDALAVLKTSTEKINVIKDDYSKNCKAIELLKEQCSNPNKLENLKKEVEALLARSQDVEGKELKKEEEDLLKSVADMLKLEIEEPKKLNNIKKEIIEPLKLIAELLNVEIGDPKKLDNMTKEVDDFKNVWNSLNMIYSKIDSKKETPFLAINPDKIKRDLDDALNQMISLPSDIRTYKAYELTEKKLKTLKKMNNIIGDLRTEAIKDRHWKKILKRLSIHKQISDLILNDFWKAPLLEMEKHLNEIINQATGELVLETYIKKSKDFWGNYELEMVRYKDKCKLIRGWDDMFTVLDEHINGFQSMSNSPYYPIFKDDIEPWKDKLEKIRLLFNEWVDVQRKWVYLEGIFFGSADIMNELASDYNKFKTIDNEFTGLMKKVASKPLVLEVISIPSIKSILEEKLKTALERIQKALYNFLEKQRQNFARFYFIGDEDLLEIIGNSRDVFKIARHFNKMFAGMNSLICKDGNELLGMVSREFEEVQFEKSVKISDDPVVYQWLRKVQEQMHFTLATKLEKAVTEISEMDYIGKVDEFIHWIEHYPAQITVLSSQILWSASIEAALTGTKTLKALPDGFTLESEENVINNMLSALSDQVLKDIKVDMRKKLEQLITELVHQRDVVRLLKNKKITNVDAFEWLYYMRFYFNPQTQEILKRLQIKMSNASFDYGFEYLGVAEKLIQTPLTDRCYLTLTQGLYFRLGGAPFGPAGTGKTESVKALGGQLGRFVLVFNCDENFDFKAMGRIFVGLCQVGAWGCFDEFNRLEERILSAVSQQILIIQLGLREYAKNIDLMGKNIKLNHQMGIFVTMNPGYAGRSQLPDNLKQLFRQMAMVKPDKDMIAQVTLYSQGYKTAERLSSKMVSLFELCSSQLSSQSHYDFGLRALKSVLVNAGNLKRREDKEREKTQKGMDIPIEEWEQNILLRSVCNTLIPKLVSEDITLFNSLLKGVFPNCVIEEVKEDELKNKIIELCNMRNLLPETKFIDKILQLYSIQKMHHGVMMVGQSGTGKSAAWKILLEALTAIDGIKGESYIIDPKAVNKENLYGKLDQTTLDWTDGVFTGTLRKILDNQRGESGKRHWIIFDGDVDPEWAENLNSVLDDNKLLTLPHGDRLQIPPNVRIMFEVESLKYATLATVSRCGMVWFSEDIVSTDMMFSHYLKRLKQNNYDDVMNYQATQSGSAPAEFETKSQSGNAKVRSKAVDSIKQFFEHNGLVQKALDEAEKYPHVMEFTKIRVVESMFALLRKGTTNILDYNEENSEFPLDDDKIYSYMSKWLIICLIWGFGGSLSLGNRTKFSEYLKSLTLDINFPNESNYQMIDYFVNMKEGKFQTWKSKVPNTDIESSKVSDADLVIPTVDTVRHQEILCSWISEHRPFILCGPPGSGKTMTLMATLKILTDFEMVFINFSSSTTPDLILKTFDHYCEYVKSSSGTILRPKQSGKYLVVFCDEINLPEQDKYSTQVVITFLREITEQNGFWRPLDKTWIKLERIQFVGACNPPTDVGRHPLNNRFLRHCPLLYVDFPGKDSLRQIYGTFNRAILRKGNSELHNQSTALTEAMVEFYTQCQQHYTPDIQPHYIYSPRELTRWKHALNESINNISDTNGLVRLWAHEALRLFQDRLVLPEEKQWCDQLVDKIATQCFPNITNEALERPILFTDLIKKTYLSCDKDELIKNIEGKLKIFYEEELNVPLVIFDSVLEHILRIDRVLKQPIGHLLLVGQSGVGKTTLSRFVAWLNNLTVFQIKAGRNYGVADFDSDLRNIMKRAGCKGEKICFIFDESNVLGPAFLERMNALLASGEVPGLFEGDEYISLINTAKEHMLRDAKGADTEEEIYKAFIKGVQRNLHVVFTMNPLSPDFSNRAASSPALYNRCVIDWFGDWSRDGLFQVAKKLTELVECRQENYSKDNMNADEMYKALVDSITAYHMVIKDLNEKLSKNAKKFNYITPRDFLDFIKHFTNLQKEKSEELNEQQVHINKGLQKIIETEQIVSELKESLAIKSVELTKKQKETKEKFEQIMEDQNKATISKEKAEKKKVEIEAMKKQIDERASKVEYELSTVLPKMEAAKNAIGNMSPKSVAALKALRKETENTRTALKLSAIIYLKVAKKKVVEKCDWAETKSAIMKEDFISTIKNTKAEDLGEKVTNIIKKEIQNPANHWNIGQITNAFKEVGLLAEWIESTVMCADISNQMEPMKNEIKTLNAKKEKLETEFNEAAKEIEMLEKSIEQLKKNYEESVVESNQIKKDMEEVKFKVGRSEKLLSNLTSEKDRWSEQMSDFKENINNLLGDTFLSSSFLAYIGFYDAFYRKYLKEKGRQILCENHIICSHDLDEVEWLTKPNDKVVWQKCSLPTDNICLENATILERFNRYPLIIDPAGQATEFIKNYYASKKLNTTSFTDNNFLKTLESALRFGYPILVQDVEKIDPIMNSLLNKEIHKQGGRNLIRIGDQEIDFSVSFNMFMITRDSSCHFTPDLCSRVTFLNFTITPSSLQNQILDIILKSERPEVNQAKEDLVKAQREFKIQLRQLEEDLLQALNSEGNLLENDKVMTRLEEIKKKSQEISIEVSKSEDIMRDLENTMNQYSPIANKSSRIFFALDTLETIHYLYRYSLTFFMDVLSYIINSKELSEIPKNNFDERQNKIINMLFIEIYHRVGYSLLNKDQLILAMRLAQINLGDKFKNEINLLLKINSNIMNDASDISEDLLNGKLTLNQRKQISELNKNEPFTSLLNEILSNKDSWNNFLNDAYAENSVPMEFLNNVKDSLETEQDKKIFEGLCKSILLLVFRPDRMMSSIQQVLKDIFNEEFINIPELDLAKAIKDETNCKSPILFCSAPGFDASTKIETLARQLNKKFLSIAIGSSEGFELVEKNWTTKIKSGEWLVLKNVHLAPNWLNELEKKLNASEPNPNFRLFLTMEFNPKIPANVLRISRKFVFELPSGIKHSLIRSYANALQPAKSEKLPKERCRLHFLLAWFHAVIGERLRYVPIGWSKFYEFNESDQRCALEAIDEWINMHSKGQENIAPNKIPWDAIRTIIHQSMYGGKIDNEYDMKILESLVNLYFNEKTFEDNYPLFKTSNENASNMLTVPNKPNNAGFIEWVNALPNVESPEWSGLPNNAEKLVRETASRRFITEMNKIQGVEDEELSSASSAGDKSQASWLVSVQEKSEKLLSSLPSEVLPLIGTEASNNDPIFRFLRREVAVAIKLLNKVRSDLKQLILMAKGEGKSTNELRDIAKNIFNDTVPSVWKVYATLELNVTEWILDLRNRINQLNIITKSDDYGKSNLWLGGLIFPEAYLTATRQSVAQQLSVPLDELVLSVELVKDITIVEKTAFVLKGLCIEGSEWDYNSNKLIMTDNLFCQLPPFLLKWSVRKDFDLSKKFPIPVYLNNMRKNLLFSVFIQNDSVLTDSDWYQRGIALISWNKTYEYSNK